MNVVDALLLPTHASRAALVTLTGPHTHGELTRAAEGVAAHLRSRGAKPGDFVAVVADNSFFALACWLGAMRAGCVAIPQLAGAADAWAPIVETTGLRFACLQTSVAAARASLLPPDAQLVTDAPLADPRAVAFADAAATPATDWPAVDGQALAMLLFTSGSTGRPRGVMLTHRNLMANARGIIEALGIVPDDRAMCVLPFQYSFGVSIVTTHLMQGACVVLDSRFMFPDKVLARMNELGCTGFAGVPSHFQSLLRRSKLKQQRFPSLKWVQQAGGRLAPELVDELRAALPGTRVHVMYGATENTARISALPPDKLDEKRGSAGRPIPGVTVAVLDDAMQPVPAGQPGRVCVRGDSTSAGYFRDEPATRETFRDGWLLTGDLGFLDAEGYLTIVDRIGDFLKCGGTRTSVKVVEDALLQCPDVVEVAVLGVPDELLGEAVAALVVARPGAEAGVVDAVRAVAKEKLPLPLQPRDVQLVAALPKSEAGKVQRTRLRALLQGA